MTKPTSCPTEWGNFIDIIKHPKLRQSPPDIRQPHWMRQVWKVREQSRHPSWKRHPHFFPRPPRSAGGLWATNLFHHHHHTSNVRLSIGYVQWVGLKNKLKDCCSVKPNLARASTLTKWHEHPPFLFGKSIYSYHLAESSALTTWNKHQPLPLGT